jgi:hypothetical protein
VFEDKLVRKYFLEFKDYKAYLGIAAFSYSDEVLTKQEKA